MSHPKKKRIVDPKLLAAIRLMPCLICDARPVDPDHITTRGAGGGDTYDNVWPLCRFHHQVRHAKGIGFLFGISQNVRLWLASRERWDVIERLKSRLN